MADPNPPPPSPSSYSIITLPKPPLKDEDLNDQWLSLAWKFRTLRLEALQTNPDAFGSTYEVENPRGIDETISRSRNPQATQIIAVKNTPGQQAIDSFWCGIDRDFGSSSANTSTTSRDALLLDVEWVGMAVLLLEDESDAHIRYVVNAMYITPSARRSGLGKALMQRCLEIAEKTAGDAGKRAVLRIVVNQGNVKARLLYEKAGFVVVGEGKYEQLPRIVDGEMQRVEITALRMRYMEPEYRVLYDTLADVVDK